MNPRTFNTHGPTHQFLENYVAGAIEGQAAPLADGTPLDPEPHAAARLFGARGDLHECRVALLSQRSGLSTTEAVHDGVRPSYAHFSDACDQLHQQ